MSSRQTSPRRDKSLRIFQANVGKSGPSHDCALALADIELFDIVLLQEPWTLLKDSRCLTKTHPAFDVFSPVDVWENNSTRPRVMTYVRRSHKLQVDQSRPAPTRDLLWIKASGITVVNVYRDPLDHCASQTLMDWPIPSQCVIAGDFNARHYTWQSGGSIGGGWAIAQWASNNNLQLLNTPNKPTNLHGNTIDLAFSNIPFAEATVEDHLATSSDHFTLSLDIPSFRQGPCASGKVRITTADELKRFSEIIASETARISPSTLDTRGLDDLAKSLVNLLQSATVRAGHRTQKRGHAAPWWNEECALAAAEYRATRRVYPLGYNMETQLARRDFQKTIRKAKSSFWQGQIDNASSNADIYKIARWAKSPSPFQPPPLQIGSTVYETQTEKADALRHATLERRTTGDDLDDPWREITPSQILPFSAEVSAEEARNATICTGNTSPGSDSITVRLLQAAWPSIGTLVQRLFEGCLIIGHHPKVFKEAEVVMLPKPGKRDLTSPRSWRPISLLSCLGKGLERLIARRIAWAAVHFRVLHYQQAGALPKRSAVDLVAALVHDIEIAFSSKKVATLVTMDIQGAFDTVMRNRLVLRMRGQGWPPFLVQWVASFMQDRMASIRYQDIVTTSTPLQCGLPQGSPVSPVLFLLYTEPIYRLGHRLGRFGYADDTALLRIGSTLEETAQLATQDIKELTDWGAANGISFDPEKTEVMHFTRSRNECSPTITQSGISRTPAERLRWLGVWLDRKLAFRTHVDHWTAKARKAAGHLRSLCNTRHGPSPAAVRRAVRACVEPVLLYGAEVWFPGTEHRISLFATKTRPQIQHLLDKLNSTLRLAIKAILPVWKPIYYRESGIPPAAQLLDASRTRFAARLKSLDLAHPLAQRTACPKIVRGVKKSIQSRPGAFRTRLERTAALLPDCRRPRLITTSYSTTTPLQLKSKEDTAADFLQWLKQDSEGKLIVYSDGSQLPGGATGWGYTIHQNGKTIREGSGRLGPAEVFDAEATGALEGLRAAANLPDTANTPIVVCLDNIAAATCLQSTASDSSQATFLEFQEIAAKHGSVFIRWTPGHTNILGNERAEALAKAGCVLPEPLEALPTLAHIRRMAKKQPKEAFQKWWQANTPSTYQALGLEATTDCPKELRIPRPALHHILAARSRHGDFAEYHERFNHEDARTHCSCNRRKSASHIFYCRKVAQRHRMRLTPSPAAAINRAIGPRVTFLTS